MKSINSSIRTTLWLFGWLLPLWGNIQPARGQEVIVHQSFSFEDGNPQKDADGAVNGVVVWKSGAVHVVIGHYDVYPPFPYIEPRPLIIQPGAIVKFALKFDVDQNGNLISWEPTADGRIFMVGGATLQIDGATITDIRDDEVGGDTNEDGNATTPSHWGIIKFSGNPNEYLTNSTIKYCAKMGGFGSIKITGNQFLFTGGLHSSSGYPGSTGPVVIDAAPVITGNVFEYSYVSTGLIADLRGMSAVVEGNTFRNAPNTDRKAGMSIWIGPSNQCRECSPENNPIGPIAGTTIVANNLFEGVGGVSIYTTPSDTVFSKTIFRAEIRNNTFRGPTNYQALDLCIEADAKVFSNEISGSTQPLRFSYNDRTEACRLDLKFNRFSLEGVNNSFGFGSVPAKLWQNGHLVNAQNNFWGHPTGPFDNSNADGRTNPRGQGLKLADGIDYSNFIGGAAPPVKDAIHINVATNPAPPLEPEANVTFNVTADYYKLESAPTGKIVVSIRDADGIILNTTETSVAVNSQNSSATLPPVQIELPDDSPQVTVEAALVPDGDGLSARSNLEIFVLQRPATDIDIFSISVSEVPSGSFPKPTRGETLRVKVSFNYSLTTSSPSSNGSITFIATERVRGTKTVLKDFPPFVFSVPPGTNKPFSGELEVAIPLRDEITEPKTDLHVQVIMKDDAGAELKKRGNSVPIREAGQVRFTPAAAGFANVVPIKVRNINGSPSPDPAAGLQTYFLVGEFTGYVAEVKYRVDAKNVTGWQLFAGDGDEALDANGNVLHRFTAQAPKLQNIATGPEQQVRVAIIGGTPIPAGTVKYRAYVKLVGPGGVVTAVDKFEIPVREAEQSLTQVVPAGASQVAFNPIPVSINFSANQNAGLAFADEFTGQFGAATPAASLAKTVADFYWNFIPLNRYWSVYDTLKAGTFTGTVSFTYNPATDFPAVSGFNEDSLVVAGLNPLNGELEALPSTLNKSARTLTTDYTKSFDTYVVASKSTTLIVGVDDPVAEVPRHFSLEQNYPNPFNPSTAIRFTVPVASDVLLRIYNLRGQQLRTRVDMRYVAGQHTVMWNGQDNYGQPVSSGVYFVQMRAGEFVTVKKAALVR